MTPAAVRTAGFRLADAQSVVARTTGFASWPALSRHVQQLRGLEGEWQLDALEIEGTTMPRGVFAQTRVLIDGDRFRTESPEGIYEGTFTIDVEQAPAHITIDFVEGPEAGNSCYALFELTDDTLTLCLGLVGAPRPSAFVTSAGSGHALERLRRASAARPANVTGGVAKRTPEPADERTSVTEDAAAFEVEMTPLLRRLEGDWLPVQLVTNGEPMPEQWLAFGSRTVVGNEVKVIFGGQVMVHAKARVDESVTPIAIDYLAVGRSQKGTVTHGILEWVGDELRVLMAPAGQPRPSDFTSSAGILSQWRRRS